MEFKKVFESTNVRKFAKPEDAIKESRKNIAKLLKAITSEVKNSKYDEGWGSAGSIVKVEQELEDIAQFLNV